jgi:hypothetical protein
MSPARPPEGANSLSEGQGRRPKGAPVTIAVERLARTRAAIARQIELRADGPDAARRAGADAHEGRPPARWFRRFSAVATTWWRGHPAHLVLDLATPALSRYASRKPRQFAGMAAAAGAVIAIARPWRLLSVTGTLLAVAKSTPWTGALFCALAAAGTPDERQPDEIVRP